MPNLEDHCKISVARTGRTYADLHSWMDKYCKELGVRHREKRHDPADSEYVRRRWGNEGVEEFHVHIIVDYKETTSKLLKILEHVKVEKDRIRNWVYKGPGYRTTKRYPFLGND